MRNKYVYNFMNTVTVSFSECPKLKYSYYIYLVFRYSSGVSNKMILNKSAMLDNKKIKNCLPVL